jgi:type II secretory pathway pseudopilin PulG
VPDRAGDLTPIDRRRPADLGVTLIEIVIAVVLLGMTVVATLSLLAATINGTALDRDHSNAHAWLQTASDILYARPLEKCVDLTTPLVLSDPLPTEADWNDQITDLIDTYEDTVQDTDNPEDWPVGNIEIVQLELWHYERDPVTNAVDEGWDNWCDPDSNLQKVKLRVRGLDGRIVEEVEVIIGGD